MKLISIDHNAGTFSVENNGKTYSGSFTTFGGFVTAKNLTGDKASIADRFKIELFLNDEIL